MLSRSGVPPKRFSTLNNMTTFQRALLIISVVILQTLRLANSTGSPLNVSPELIEEAFSWACENAERVKQLENNLDSNGGTLDKNVPSPEVRHYGNGGDERTVAINANQYIFQEATKYLRKRLALYKDQARTELPYVDLSQGGEHTQAALSTCRSLFNIGLCNASSPYRTADGSCNNVDHPIWGMANSCLDRILPPSYRDGVESSRKRKFSGELPNPREVSTFVHDDVNRPSLEITLMVMQWGQFMDHEITLSPMTITTESMEFINCCPYRSNSHPACQPIQISRFDYFYRDLGRTCMNFVRSSACNSDCTLGPRSQVNILTAYIDASNMYGHDDNETKSLRELQGGRLRVFQSDTGSCPAGDLLPQVPLSQSKQCTRGEQESECFVSGDERSNEHPALTSMHTIWLRNHNRIAAELQSSAPNLSDEDLFQITRRIMGAQMQIITYNEFLPVVIGPAAIEEYALDSAGPGRTVYDPSTRPNVLTEFSTAAYRFGHTIIQNEFPLVPTACTGSSSELNLTDNYFNEESVLSGQIPALIGGLASGPAQEFDRHVVTAVTNNVYKVTGTLSGLDLVALNIQRGRDHGLQSYPHYVEKCLGKKVEYFRDLETLMEEDTWRKLRGVYRSVDDVDLFVGGLSEKRVDGGVVGPTFACIIGQQFHGLKYGDRFFFDIESSNGAIAFSDEQLEEIRKTTLAQVLCQNSGLDQINKNVFVLGSPAVDCTSLPSPDYSVFVSLADAQS